jgi:hypothetical protein
MSRWIWRGQWCFRLLNYNVLLVEARILVIYHWLLVLFNSFIFWILLLLKLIILKSISRRYLSLFFISSLICLIRLISILQMIFLLNYFSYLSEPAIQRVFIIFLHIGNSLFIIYTSCPLILIIILCLPPRWVNHSFIFILQFKIDKLFVNFI